MTLNSLSAELHKLDDIHWICPLMQCSEEVRGGERLAKSIAIIQTQTEIFCCLFFNVRRIALPSVFSGVGQKQQEQQQHEAEDHPQGEEGEGEAAQAEVQQLPLR